MSKNKIIKAEILFDGKRKKENKTIVIQGDKIIEVSDKNYNYDFSGIVTPCFIDPHSHIGMCRQGEPDREEESNEHLEQISPLNNPLNSIYFDDRAFKEAVDFGVLYSCIVPGSGNLLGGKAMVIKNFVQNRKDAVVKDYGFKMALGYNPKSTTTWQGKRPTTRMGIYSLIEQKFDSILLKEKKAKTTRDKKLYELSLKQKEGKITDGEYKKERLFVTKEFGLEFSPEDLAILELLEGNKTVKVHVHKEDDVLYLIHLVNKYHIKVTADHTCDVSHTAIFNELADNDINVVYGPLGSLDYKVELKNADYKNTKKLMDSRVFYGLMTDHPVILTPMLRDSLKYFLIQGMSEEEAVSLITYRNACILGLDDQLGTIEPGKTASLIVWDKNPLHLGAFPAAVIAEGNTVRDKNS